MGKRLEEKIQEEIRRRVIEEDERRQHEIDTLQGRDATRKALAEITTLSQEEVDAIAGDVRGEMENAARRRRRIGGAVVLVVLIMAGVAALKWVNRPQPFAYEEPFDDGSRGWEVGEDFDHKRAFRDGDYVFSADKDDWCYWDTAPVALPDAYAVELRSRWLKGKFDEYGLMLLVDAERYLVFQLRGDGAASWGRKRGDDWEVNAKWSQNRARPGQDDADNLQRIEVTGDTFTYFINGALMTDGELGGLKPKMVGLRTCGQQTVAFKEIRVTDPGGEILFADALDGPDAGWEPKETFTKKRYFENGRFVFAGNREDWCYWSDAPFDLGPDYDVRLSSVWVRGEQQNFGLMLQKDDKTYLAFEVKGDGAARFLRNLNGEYKEIGDYRETGTPTEGKITQTVQVRGDRFTYRVNGREVDDGVFMGMDVEEIGLRVCGRQTVAFDHLSVRSP